MCQPISRIDQRGRDSPVSELDLIIDGLLPKQGRQTPVQAARGRNLSKSDIAAIRKVPTGSLETQTGTLAKIRDTHHGLARLVAAGRRNEEIGAITGYSPSYISQLKSDPAFKNLVEYYREVVTEEYKAVEVSLHDRLSAVSMVAAEELLDRVTTKPEDFTNNELNELIRTTADRTGFGPQSRTTNVNVNVDLATRLGRARERAQIGADLELRALPQGGPNVATQETTIDISQSIDLAREA